MKDPLYGDDRPVEYSHTDRRPIVIALALCVLILVGITGAHHDIWKLIVDTVN